MQSLPCLRYKTEYPDCIGSCTIHNVPYLPHGQVPEGQHVQYKYMPPPQSAGCPKLPDTLLLEAIGGASKKNRPGRSPRMTCANLHLR